MDIKELCREIAFHAKQTWTWAWLYIATLMTIISLAEKTVRPEDPVVILFCILMALIGQRLSFKSPSLLVASTLGAIATLLTLPATSNVGPFHLQLWAVVGVCFGAAAITVLPLSLMFGKRQKETVEDKSD